ncbi:MAG: DUF4340 domain-containing protein [Gammaproteobacteria bacterium]|nr:DUF4340 domain-containing protein [Gammaproteobacteria bacterium]
MNRAKGIVNKTTLSALLAIQVVVVGVLLAARSGGIEAPEPFLKFDADMVDSLRVSNSDGSVDLAKVDGAWQLPGGVPASEFKVDSVLEGFADAGGSWPVANTASTRERFEVTEDNHQRHVVLKSGEDVLADIYLGTSPGHRKTHARRAGEDEIYAIGFSNYEAGVKAADWIDRSLLRPKGDVAALRRLPGDPVPPAQPDPESDDDSADEEAPAEPVAGFELRKDEEGGWVSADGTELDQGKASTFAGRFSGLSVTGVTEATLPESATMTFAIADDDGEQTLTVFALEDGEKYVAVSDRVPGAYELSKYIAEQMNKPLSDLAPDPPEDDADDGSDASAETETSTEPEAQAETDTAEPSAVEEADATEDSEATSENG